jgi:lysophospholipase L1-like esterase
MHGRFFRNSLTGVLINLVVVSVAFAVSEPPPTGLTAFSPTDVHVTSMGRFASEADGSVRFGYPGVTFSFNFSGKQLSVDAGSTSDKSFLEVTVDGRKPRAIRLSRSLQTCSIINATVARQHHVEIMHRTETWIGIATIKQFLTDGKLLEPTPLPRRKILVLGDSVTCGEAINRVPGETENSKWWDPRHSYGMRLAKSLGAQVQLVCMGGHGLIRTWEGKTDELNLPDFYQLAIADQQHPVHWDQAQYDPDLIISAIGTNDFTKGIPDKETYVNAYAKFLSTLLSDHRHAQIVVTEGAILNDDKKAAIMDYIDESIRGVGDARLHHAVTTHFPGDKINAHPTRKQHASMAAELLRQVRKIMNW